MRSAVSLAPMAAWLLMPLLGHMALVFTLYVWLTIVRQAAVKRGEARIGDFVRADGDPARARRIQRNLSNQFELPMIAYFCAAVLVHAGAVGWFDIAMAWLFLLGRLIHTGVQTLSDNVALRGQVFVVNTLGVIGLVAHVGWLVVMALR